MNFIGCGRFAWPSCDHFDAMSCCGSNCVVSCRFGGWCDRIALCSLTRTNLIHWTLGSLRKTKKCVVSGCDEMRGVGRMSEGELGNSRLHWTDRRCLEPYDQRGETRQGWFVEVAACRAETADLEPSKARTKTDRHRIIGESWWWKSACDVTPVEAI